ncbi:peptidase S58 family protein [Pseudolabrys taiwanensis]|uniref:Peptidase S58 family protein n=1 Tax=Pseudolabrys taiwanensis TaxID=331696 RepID=A0A345ZQU9_9HYPH|nr:P1 family peptidase [Pseudolabrys taiwanensis]AXK79296.1 peptidase S58 family protein [Pseudolabrys taiwanensis]
MTRNLITDIPGIRVGHAGDMALGSGSTVIVFDKPTIGSIDIRGGGPGTRETAMLEPDYTVDNIDAVTLSGGSAFGLEAGAGAQALLREKGRGFRIRDAVVPIVPGAILFDLLAGGNKDWGRYAPYREFGYEAAKNARADFALGTVGAGVGATTRTLKGGLGSASAKTQSGFTVGAIVATNAAGNVTIGSGPHFWAAPYEHNKEFGGRGWPAKMPPNALAFRSKGQVRENTTIALVATDAALTKSQAKRLAIMAQDGMSRAIYPVHTPLDGDIVFAMSVGRKPLPEPIYALSELGTLAANVLARAIARGVYEATPLPFRGALPSWKDKFG